MVTMTTTAAQVMAAVVVVEGVSDCPFHGLHPAGKRCQGCVEEMMRR